MEKRLLVVSIFYNREDLVHDSVESVVEQLDDDMVLLLIDDGSTDSTYERLKQWESGNVIVETHKNKGFVKSIAEAAGKLNTDYIAIHGSGDKSYPGRLRKQMDFLDNNDNFGVVGCYSKFLNVATGKEYFQKKYFSGDAADYLREENLYHHGEVMFRRSCYEKVGGYRSFFNYAQDYDLWLRMSHETFFHVIPEVLYERKVSVEGSVSSDPTKIILQKYCASFARYCNEQRIKKGDDPLSKYGSCVSLLGVANNNLANKRIFLTSVRFIAERSYGNAGDLLKHVMAQGGIYTLPCTVLYFLIQTSPRLARSIIVSLAKLLNIKSL